MTQNTTNIATTTPVNTNRFDYVKYDQESEKLQWVFKEAFQDLSRDVDTQLTSPRAKALIQTKLEEAYMWVGKAIRDDQYARTGNVEMQESRNAS